MNLLPSLFIISAIVQIAELKPELAIQCRATACKAVETCREQGKVLGEGQGANSKCGCSLCPVGNSQYWLFNPNTTDCNSNAVTVQKFGCRNCKETVDGSEEKFFLCQNSSSGITSNPMTSQLLTSLPTIITSMSPMFMSSPTSVAATDTTITSTTSRYTMTTVSSPANSQTTTLVSQSSSPLTGIPMTSQSTIYTTCLTTTTDGTSTSRDIPPTTSTSDETSTTRNIPPTTSNTTHMTKIITDGTTKRPATISTLANTSLLPTTTAMATSTDRRNLQTNTTNGSKDTTPSPTVTFTTDEESPTAHIVNELNKLSGDLSTKIKKFENELALSLSRHQNDSEFHSNSTSVLVRKIAVPHPGMQPRMTGNSINPVIIQPPGSDSRSLVSVPLWEISNSPTGRDVDEITLILANWKIPARDVSSSSPTLPPNGSVLTVKYFVKDESRPYPVSYQVHLDQDYTEVYLPANQTLKGVERYCAWLNTTTARWSKEGCKAVTNSAAGVFCKCEHTTTFAVLLSLDTVDMPFLMGPVTTALEVASISCLLLTIIFLIISRHGAGIDSSTMGVNAWGMRLNRNNSQISLCIALVGLHFSTIFSDVAKQNADETPCIAVTFLTHYFLLATAFWSLNEGLGIFIKMLPNFTMNVQYRQLTVFQTMLGWMLPLVIATTCLAYGLKSDTYMDTSVRFQSYTEKVKVNATHEPPNKYDQCWLSLNSGMIWAAFIPVLLILLVNIFILLYVIRGIIKMNKTITTYGARCSDVTPSRSVYLGGEMHRGGAFRVSTDLPSVESTESQATIHTSSSSKHKKRLKHVVSVTRSFGILMPILAVPWILAFLGNIHSAQVPILSVHVIVNGLQGVQIFLLYCVVSKADWLRIKRKWKNSKMSRILSNYMHRRESIATSQSRVTYFAHSPKQSRAGKDKNANSCHLNADTLKYGSIKSGRVSPVTVTSKTDTLRSKNGTFGRNITKC